MNKLNKDLIETKKKLTKVEKKIEKLNTEAQYLQDKLHFYFDSSQYDTTDAESFIISDFWSKAYDVYRDGGYITNDEFISEVRFKYETQLLDNIIDKSQIKKERVIDICCGNGRYTQHFSKTFLNTVGIDLSEPRISKNIEENKNSSVHFYNADFMNLNESEFGTFDLVFASDIFTYTHTKNINTVFKKLLNLVNKNGILLLRESTRLIGYEDYKSRNYVAYYRNKKFYKKGIFKKNFEQSYRNFGYNLYHMNKYFNVHPNAKEQLKENPGLIKNMVMEAVDKHQRSCHFYVYKV